MKCHTRRIGTNFTNPSPFDPTTGSRLGTWLVIQVILVLGISPRSTIALTPLTSSSTSLLSSSLRRIPSSTRFMRLHAATDSNSGVDDDDYEALSCSSIQGVTLKMAFDRQGGVADLSQTKSERFTCSESLDMVHRLRRDSDAVLVGRKTVEFDDCTLTVRRVATQGRQQPLRVVIDPHRQLDLAKYQIATDGLDTLIYYYESQLDGIKTECYSSYRDEKFPNVQWIGLPSAPKRPPASPQQERPGLSVRDIVQDLRIHQGLEHIMVEGGPATARQFLQEKMVDRAILVFAPMQFQIPVPSEITHADFKAAGLELIREGTLGVDRVEYWSRPGLPWPSVSSSSTTTSSEPEEGSTFWP